MRLSRRDFILNTIALCGSLFGYRTARPAKRLDGRMRAVTEPAINQYPDPDTPKVIRRPPSFSCLYKIPPRRPVIKVVGIGNGGCSAVHHMIKNGINDVEFICTHIHMHHLAALEQSHQPTESPHQFLPLLLDAGVAKGIDVDANPDLGRRVTMESKGRIAEALSGADMVIIIAGMGGGIGCGGAPVVAEVAKGLGALTVAVVTKPFRSKSRDKATKTGIPGLLRHVDSLFTVPHEALLMRLRRSPSLAVIYRFANKAMLEAVKDITDPILRPGFINLDFADIRAVMHGTGRAVIGTASAIGTKQARMATESAFRALPLKDRDVTRASGVLVSLTAQENLSLQEFSKAGDAVRKFVAKDTTVIMGTVIDPTLGGNLRVTVVLTGFDGHHH